MRALLRFTGLWRLVFARLLAEPALTVSLLFGWAAFVALTAAIPMYTDAVNQQLLARELSKRSSTAPTYGFHYTYTGGTSAGATWENYDALRQYMAANLPQAMGLRRTQDMHYGKSDLFAVYPAGGQYTARELLTRGNLGFIRGLEEQITVVEGGMPQPAAEDGPLEVLISQKLAQDLGLQPGELITLFDQGGETAAGVRPRLELQARIVGVWQVKDATSRFWYVSPSAFDTTFLLLEPQYVSLAASGRVPHALYSLGWYQEFDGSHVRAENVPGLLRRINRVNSRINVLLPGTGLTVSPVSALLRYQRAASAQAIQLVSFLIPFIGLVIYFIVLVASGSVARQRLEIAMLKSRGSSSMQVFGIYIFQAALLGAAAIVIGPILGRYIAQAIGATYSFLSFTTREPLNVAITVPALRYALGGLIIAMLATVLPAVGASRMTVVGARAESARSTNRPFWQRYYLDLLLLAVAIYGYYQLFGQGRIAFLQMGRQESPFSNPLLFLAPALFILAAGLVSVRIFPALLWLPSWIVGQTSGVSLLLAMRNLTRAGYAHVGLLLILILTTGLGTFTASAARTMDENVVSQIRYRVGADVALREGVAIASQPGDVAGAEDDEGPSDERPVYLMAPVQEHLNAQGVRAVARVGQFKGQARASGYAVGNVYGIDRLDFPQVGFFRSDFADQSLGALMNALASHRDGILVSEDVLSATGLTLGDTLPLAGLFSTGNKTVPFTIVGVIHYFPTALPDKGSIFVTNLDYIFENIGGEVPYDVWLSVADEVDLETLVDDLERIGFRIMSSQDARVQIAAAQTRPERTGLFGFLSVGFVVTVGLSMLAQVIYALLSFRQRFIQFGMIRAIGLSSWQLAVSLSSELALITLVGIGVGLYVGLITSELFIPFLQVGYTAADLVPPFLVTMAWGDVAKAVLAMLVTSFATNLGVIWFLTRIRVFEALKLGEAMT